MATLGSTFYLSCSPQETRSKEQEKFFVWLWGWSKEEDRGGKEGGQQNKSVVIRIGEGLCIQQKGKGSLDGGGLGYILQPRL